MAQKYHKLRLLLGDQLNASHSWFEEKNEGTLYVLMETRSETGYVRHHIQKVIGFFLAMRAFAEALQAQGRRVHYIRLDEPGNRQSISGNIRALIEQYDIQEFEYLLPDEYRLDAELKKLCRELKLESQSFDTEHFLTQRQGVEAFFEGKKTYLLEYFYRHIRKQYNILMEEDGDTPLTGRWNYDQENRKKMPKGQDIPQPLHFQRDVSALVAMLKAQQVETIGSVDEKHFTWPVTRRECLELLEYFVRNQLHLFGAYQDAMSEKGYLLFHSKLSFAMNVKLLHPLEVVDACVQYWKDHQDSIDISQIEGFVRQVIGWREYMRGIYWAKMPAFAEMNYFNHQAKLPKWFWTGDTQMNCLSHAIGQSLEMAYAHHIQRLMVTGNFALLLGVHPDELDQWYLGIYMDAIEWVEITNTRGMSQFADGGIVGTKPYVSSANYMHKMGDYCSNCQYDKKAKYGKNACPFNSLYWDFYDRHSDKLGNNPRIGMMYRVWNRMDGEEREKILQQAAEYKGRVEEL
ncbi:MAG: cryptochrome/photolyase family protein [Lewinellaceae bacterium]|nr:cryptochrome/photolyase family protein [Phaeodactylibacter sp.]MCB0611969.1 cryptochrome/photolyase family protein [Phaeodactylibacter sp.]MCB9348955.1 cryptochrome/photolyase family protein [Lewinellaceae bacterium]